MSKSVIEIVDDLAENVDALRNTVAGLAVAVGKDAYLNAEQAAQYLGVSAPTFRTWVNAGHIHKLEIEGMARYSRNLLDRDMLAHAVRNGAPSDAETNAKAAAILAKAG